MKIWKVPQDRGSLLFYNKKDAETTVANSGATGFSEITEAQILGIPQPCKQCAEKDKEIEKLRSARPVEKITYELVETWKKHFADHNETELALQKAKDEIKRLKGEVDKAESLEKHNYIESQAEIKRISDMKRDETMCLNHK